MRTVKDPKERKKDIIDKAAELFINKGYESASVNMIVEELGIAKGTFYHYFKSKEEVLEAVLEQLLDSYAVHIKEMLDGSNMNGLEKFLHLMRGIMSSNQGPEELTKHIEDNKDARLHQQLDQKFIEKFNPIIVDILNQGVREGIFQIVYTEEITQILLIGIRGYMHIHMPKFGDMNYMQHKIAALEELFNKVLFEGESRGRIKLMG